MLNKNEQRVLKIIEDDPFISQKKIGEELELTRSTVATIISSLTQKKFLLGRAYVVNQSSEIYCIGAMNVDRKYNLLEDMVLGTSNPAISNVNVGGVARNIAENLGRKQLDVSLISLGGEDQDFHFIKQETESYVNMQHVTPKNIFSTGAYSAVLDSQGEMELALADMEIYDEMNIEWISSYQNILKEARLLVLDLNLPYETVEYLLSFAQKYEIEVFIVPVSGPKMNRLPKVLEGVTWLIVNQDESETFFNMKVKSEEDFTKLIDRWLQVGVENVVITRGAKESLYGNQQGTRYRFVPPEVEEVVDVTGAGDAYAAGIVYGHLKGFDPRESIRLGMTNSYYTIQSPYTVRIDLTEEKLLEQTKHLFQKEKS